jgi:dihydroorotate dehydrogenase electron transfer subunit
MKQTIFTITENIPLTANVYRMVLQGDTADIFPGQFVNIKLDGLYLRRPISVCDLQGDCLTIIYKVVGKGTEVMSRMSCGETLDVLTGLGNGYDLSLSGNKPVLLGGGVGVPPMYLLAKKLIEQGREVLQQSIDCVERENREKCRMAVGLGAMSGLLLLIVLM